MFPPRISILTGDLYEFTMSAAYHAADMGRRAAGGSGAEQTATFELWVRRLPPEREFLVTCGLKQALAFLRNLNVTPEEIAYLQSLPVFARALPSFWERLRTLRFTGEVWAMPEGTVCYAEQPLLRITAPLIEAQLVETALLSILGFQTAIASKAARVVHAAAGRPLIEMGARHAHGPEAALWASYAAHLGGCSATSNTEAGMHFGIPVTGTMAHSYLMAQPGGEAHEAQAFEDFCRLYGQDATLLLDTYDTLRAVDRMIARGLHPRSVRLDSGDLLALSRQVRARLDSAGLADIKIVATGDLDEYRIAELVSASAPIDVFGVGTALSVSKDHPYLSAVYKLVNLEGEGIAPGTEGRAKLSPEKETQPGKKQVWRFLDSSGARTHDMILPADAPAPEGAIPLLEKVLSGN